MNNSITNSSLEIQKPTSSPYKNKIITSDYNEVSSTFKTYYTYSETSFQKQSIIFEVSQWFLKHEPMSHKKLQKLCYYAYAWFLVFFNDKESMSDHLNKLCPIGFEAWIHGPVSQELYQYYKNYGWNDIPSVDSSVNLTSDVEDLLNQVWETYGHFTADQLEQLTHSEDPWLEARKGLGVDEPSKKIINDNTILSYYSKMVEL